MAVLGVAGRAVVCWPVADEAARHAVVGGLGRDAGHRPARGDLEGEVPGSGEQVVSGQVRAFLGVAVIVVEMLGVVAGLAGESGG
ncbi:hypothetical protein [Nocardia fluminea]|uniref:hypothetical protein n=1 Tax=Nocardia fluminea TaxID=134984 RepID=UPI003667FC22